MNLADCQRLIDQSPQSRGRTAMQRWVRGKRLCASDAIRARCFDCMGGFCDGRLDCRVPMCPLYPWQPYGKRDRASTTVSNITQKEASYDS